MMTIFNSQNRFGGLGMFIHWAMAGVILAAFVFGQVMEDAPKGAEKLSVLGWHVVVGGAVLAMVAVRIVWRRLDPPPALPVTVSAWERKLAWLVHMALYAAMILLPFTGFLAATSLPVSIPLVGGFELAPLFPSKVLHDGAGEVHETLVGLLVASLALHVMGAVWHRYICKDGVTERMIPFLSHPPLASPPTGFHR